MPYVSISDRMKNIAGDILGTTSSNITGINIDDRKGPWYYDITCRFMGRRKNTKDEFSFYPVEITSLIIKQNFIDSYLDNIELSCRISISEYIDLYENYRDLKCTLLLRRVDEKSNTLYTDDPVMTKTFMCIIKNKEDLFMHLPKPHLVSSTSNHHMGATTNLNLPILKFNLMEEDAYNLKRKAANFILRDATVADGILECAKLCGVNKVYLVSPDNTTRYTNFVIPPLHKFSSVFNFIQQHYGVYNKGLTYYYTEGVLYVYPPYETKPTTPISAHLYYVGPNNYLGLQRYHASSEKVIHIVANITARSQDLVESGAEQLGNALLIQHADRMYDDFFSIDNKEQIRVNPNNTTLSINAKDTIGIQSNMYNPEFHFDNNNPFAIKSLVNFYRRTMLVTGWMCAVPYTFKPGWTVHYHYDNEDKTIREDGAAVADNLIYSTRSGIVEVVNYVFGSVGRRGNRFVYGCNADLQLSIEIEEAKEVTKEVSKTNTLTKSNTTTTTVQGSTNRLF